MARVVLLDGALFSSQTGALKMKRYYQLILISTALLSIIGVVYYKIEHDKLYHILQVLESFGPSYSSLEDRCKAIQEVVKKHKDLQQEDDQWFSGLLKYSEWMPTNGDLMVYSAYWNPISQEILVLGLLKSIFKISGNIWIENDNKIEVHVFKDAKIVTLFDNDEPYKANLIHIDFKQPGSPFRVEICSSQNVVLCLELNVVSLVQSKNLKSTGICVLPEEKHFNSKFLLEFLAFHSNIGIRHFVIYGETLTPSSQKVIHASEHSMLEIIIKKWNLPASVVGRKIAEFDCLLSLYNFVDNGMLLDLFSYFVPITHSSVRGFLTDGEVKIVEGNRVLLKSLHICQDAFKSIMDLQENVKVPEITNANFSDYALYYGIHDKSISMWEDYVNKNSHVKLKFNLHSVIFSALHCDSGKAVNQKDFAISVLSKIQKYIRGSSLYSRKITI